jgi:Transposase DDE domain
MRPSLLANAHSMTEPATELDWRALLSILPPDFEAVAEEHGQINAQWPNAKIDSASMLLRFILLHVGADLPLRQTVALIAESGGPRLSAVRLHHRMRRAQPYLAALVAKMMPPSGTTPERWGGYEMVCVDATAVSGPGADGTDLRLHAVLRLHDLGISAAHVTGDTEGETFKRFAWTKGQLVIGDRGYSNPPGIAHVVDQGADLLVRVNRGALPLVRPDGTEIDVLEWVRGFGGNAAVEIDAHVVLRVGKTTRAIPGRLIGRQLPKAAAERARQRARREHGPSVSADVMEAAGYILLFTTAPTSRLSAARCMDAYRLRWQIELQFKRWKSLCHFDRLPNYRDDTMQAWLTAKLLLGLLLERLGSSPVTSEQAKRSIAREPWKLTSIIWPAIVAALLPIGLSHLVEVLPAIALRVDREQAFEARQLEVFRSRFTQNFGATLGDNC